jgi:RNA polymerase sigma factor (sigma-70 family)
LDIVQIIEGCRRKDRRFQKMLYERFYGYALKIAFRYVYRYDSAVEVTNDGFVKLFLQMAKFRNEREDLPENILKERIKQIIIQTSIDDLRRNNMAPEIVDIPEEVWEEESNILHDDQLLLYKELTSYVKNLHPLYRIVFNMFVIDGFTHFHIGNILGITVEASRSYLFAARDIMQKIVDGQDVLRSRRS